MKLQFDLPNFEVIENTDEPHNFESLKNSTTKILGIKNATTEFQKKKNATTALTNSRPNRLQFATFFSEISLPGVAANQPRPFVAIFSHNSLHGL